MEELKNDVIHKPKHYCFSKFEPKDVIREWGLNFNLGSAVKYIARAGRKDDIIQDLKKAREFLTFEIEALEAERGEREDKEPEGYRLSEVICMSPEEFTSNFRDLQNGSGFPDAYNFEFVDDLGRSWILTECDYTKVGIGAKLLDLTFERLGERGVVADEISIRLRS